MGQSIPQQHPAVVLRSHYSLVRGLLAVALVAIVCLAAAVGAGATYGYVLPMSRAQESEADRIGLILMAMAGYDPREAVGVWERMRAANTGPHKAEWLSTHPADTTRIADIRRWLPEAMKYYRPQ